MWYLSNRLEKKEKIWLSKWTSKIEFIPDGQEVYYQLTPAKRGEKKREFPSSTMVIAIAMLESAVSEDIYRFPRW